MGYGAEFPTMTATSTSDPLVLGPQVPAAPSNLTATLGALGNTVDLAWTNNATTTIPAGGFYVERAINGGAFTRIATVAAPTTTYTDTTVVAGDLYRYRVQAFNLVGVSAFSNTAQILLAPPAPTSLVATLRGFPELAAPQIDLAWSETSANLTGFVVQRSQDAGVTWGAPISLGPLVTAYTDTTVLPGFAYTYRVAAVNGPGTPNGGTSPYTLPSNAITVPLPPIAPSNVNATTSRRAGSASLRMTWTDNANNPNNEAGFEIWVSTSPTFASHLTFNAGANATSYSTNAGIVRQTWYYVQIRAYNISGPSPWIQANPYPVRTP